MVTLRNMNMWTRWFVFLGVVWPQWLYQAVWRHHRCPERVLWCPFESLPETQGLHGGAVDSRGQSSGEHCQVYHGENRWPDYNWLVFLDSEKIIHWNQSCVSEWLNYKNLHSTENKPKKELIQMLVRRGYDSDPLKRWKELQAKDKVIILIWY